MKTQGSSARGGCIPLLIIMVILIFIPVGFELGRRQVTAHPSQTSQAGMPAITPTHSPVAWTRQNLIAGLNLVYAETDPDRNTATLWIAPVKNLSLRKQIAILDHASNHPLTGLVSPDSSRIALLRLPPAASQSPEENKPAGELWLANSDGNQAFQAASQVAYLGGWSADSRKFIFARRLQDPPPAHNELWQFDVAESKASLLIGDVQSADLRPLGWNPFEGAFYVASTSPSGQWSVLSANPTTHQFETHLDFPRDPEVQNLSLSPTGDQLLLELDQSEQCILMVMSLDGKFQQPLASAPAQTGMDPFNAIWGADGKSLILRHLPDGSPVQFDQIDLANRRVLPLAYDQSTTAPALAPISWSPDSAWLVLRSPAFIPDSSLYIQAIDTGKVNLFPRTSASKVLFFLGWVQN